MTDPTQVPDRENDRSSAICHEISQRLVAIYKQQRGIGPTEARTYYVDDLVVCILRGGYSRVEENLRRAGREHSVAEQRLEWREMMREQFVELVRSQTGREVIGFMGGNQQGPDMVALVFVLEPDAR